MILSINNDPIVWNLYNEDTKRIDNESILQYIKYNKENDTNDYYSAWCTKSNVIKDDNYLKEVYVDQVAYVAYNIRADFYNIIKNEITYYHKYHEQYDKGNISGAQICIAKAGYKTYKELEARFNQYNEIYSDITDKYNQFETFLRENGFLNVTASINGRSNEVNQLAEEIYLDNINEHVENVKDDLSQNQSMHDTNLEILETQNNELNKLYTRNKEYEESIELCNVTLKAKLVEREELKALVEEYQADNDNLKIDLEIAADTKEQAEKNLNKQQDEINFYLNYKYSYGTATHHIDDMLYDINQLKDGEIFNSIHYNDQIVYIKRLIDDTLEKIDIKQICDETEDLLVMYNNFVTAAEDYQTSNVKAYLSDMNININNILRYLEAEIVRCSSGLTDLEYEVTISTQAYDLINERYIESSAKLARTENSLNLVLKEINESNLKIDTIKVEQAELLEEIKKKEYIKSEQEAQTQYTEFKLNINLRSLEVLEKLQKEMSDLQVQTNENKEEVHKEITLARKLHELNQAFLNELDELAKDHTNNDPDRVAKLVDKYYSQSVYYEMLNLKNIRLFV